MTDVLTTSTQAQDKTESQECGVELFNSFHLDLERFLNHFETALTHYEVLNIEQSATQEEVKLAYHRALALLYPPYKVSERVPEKMLARMERAFSRVSWAFSVLASFQRRTEYDNSVLPRVGAPVPPQPEKLPAKEESTATPAAPIEAAFRQEPPLQPSATQEDINIKNLQRQQRVYNETSSSAESGNRRRCERFNLSLPARITGHDRSSGKWHEMTTTIDVSRTGLTFQMRGRVKHGMVLYLTVPLPVKLRNHSFAASTYSVYALVRRVEPLKDGKRLVGVEFIGENPPAGYLDKPWATFRTDKWSGAGRRRHSRIEKIEVVSVEYFTETMKSITRVMGRTEDVSSRGARICVRAAPSEFETVRISCPMLGFESFAKVRNRFIGKDGFERICVQFMDNKWPVSQTNE